MKIKPHKDPDNATPKTRRELLTHLWGVGLATGNDMLAACNVFKEGPMYAIRFGRTIAATYVRRIDALTFSQWQQKVITTPQPL